jgi:hypothetical protein
MMNVRISELANVRIDKAACGTVKLLRFFIYSLIVLLFAQGASAQSVSATLKSDKDNIVIGDHLKVSLTVKYTKGLSVVLPKVADTLGNMDVIAVKMDTAQEGNNYVLVRTYTTSAFDSGAYHAGPVNIILKKATGEEDTIVSNMVPIAVNTLPVDTTKPLKAIKGPLEIPRSWREYVAYIGAGLLLWLTIVIAVMLFMKYRKQKPVVVERAKPKEPAHIWARAELKKLEEEKLWQKDEIKQYYSRLTDILRMYLEYRYGWLALESTTEEIEADMKGYNLKEKAKDYLLEILRAADLVKFAKMQPLPDINIRMMESANKFIDFTEAKETKGVETK